MLAHFMLSSNDKLFLMEQDNKKLQIRSTVFAHNGHIPVRYTCEGENVNPPLEFSEIPEGTKSLALIVEDPDAPHGVFDHWLVWNISPNTSIAEAMNPGISGTNSFGKTGFGGPCPPSGTHRYFFRVYALDAELELEAGANKVALRNAMEGHILAEGELMGMYKKKTAQAVK
jgi:Raf kinase inhibitor-like YbhB/YbcL family protein